jgi:hypothetical protein
LGGCFWPVLYYSYSEALPEFFEVLSEVSMRSISDSGKRATVRLLGLTLTLILAAVSAQAYTVVLRSGRIVEIPGPFAVTKSAVIYEVASGIQVSIQLVTVNIQATEKVNNEGPGSFLRRIQSAPPAVVDPVATNEAERSITNRELEPFARSRKEGEIAYEQRRKELGLPSIEESRQRAAAEAAALRERFAQEQLDERASEAYWRERAVVLKTEMASADAEINSVRQQLDWLPSPNSLASVTVGVGSLPLLPLVPFGNAVINPTLQSRPVRTGVFVAPNRGPQMSGRIGVGPVRAPARGIIPGGINGNRFRGRQFNGFSPFPIFPATAAFGYQPYDLGYDRTALMMRLNELIARRAGLQARWRALEEEARHAGALPGWLRP